MHTNTSRILTAFSDLEHESDLVFPSNRDILTYLHRYAETFALTSRIRFGTRVELLSRGESGWLVEHSGTTEVFERVVVASGRFQSPCIPTVPGLDTFAGAAGSELHVQLPRGTSLPRQARSRRGRRHQRARDRRRARPARRGARRGDPAAAAVRAAEIRRGSAVRLPDLHAVRNPRERDSARGRDRPAAQGDRRRSRWKPGAVRCAGARSVAVRGRRHARPAVPAAGGGGPNHGAAVDDIASTARP